MSVNGLWLCQQRHVLSRRRVSAPLKLQSDCIHNVHVQGDQQTDRTFMPAVDE